MTRLLSISTLALALAVLAGAASAEDLTGDTPSSVKVNLLGKSDAAVAAEIRRAADKVCSRDFSGELMIQVCTRDTYERAMAAARAQLAALSPRTEQVAFAKTAR